MNQMFPIAGFEIQVKNAEIISNARCTPASGREIYWARNIFAFGSPSLRDLLESRY